MFDKKTKYSSIANVNCKYCGGKGYVEIHNAYDPAFREIEGCTLCLLTHLKSKSSGRYKTDKPN